MVAPSANRLLVLACVSPGTQGQKMISKPHRIFAENLEQTALDQFESAMEQPFAVKGVPKANIMKFYESNDLPEDAVPLRVNGLGFDPDLNYLLDYMAEYAASQWMDDGDGDCYKGWPRTFVILDDEGKELGRRKVDVDYDPTFMVVGE